MTDDVLFIGEDDRYARFRLISWWRQEKLAAARILVVGAGALGNEVLKNLALLGVGRIFIVDFDTIEPSNLTRSVLYRAEDAGRPKAERAAAAVRAINPDVKVRALNGNVLTDLGLGVFADVDLVIGCLDNREARLWINRQCWRTGRPWIDGAIQEISGTVKVFVPPDHACYECAMSEADYRLMNLRYSCPLLRREDVAEGKVPTAPTIAAIVAGLQTQEALKLLHGMPVQAGGVMAFSGESNHFYTTRLQRRDDCLSHETWPPPKDLPLSAASQAEELFRKTAGDAILIERELLVSLSCAPCGTRTSVMRPRILVGHREGFCGRCGQLMRSELTHQVDRGGPLASRSLRELGAAPYDLLRIRKGEGVELVRLAGDREDVMKWS